MTKKTTEEMKTEWLANHSVTVIKHTISTVTGRECKTMQRPTSGLAAECRMSIPVAVHTSF